MSHTRRRLKRILKTTALYGISLLVVAPLSVAINALDAAANSPEAAQSAATNGARQVPSENQPYVSETPTAPSSASQAQPAVAQPPYPLPPVDPNVKAQAESELSRAAAQATPSAAPADTTSGTESEPVQLVSYAPPAPLPANPNANTITSAPLPATTGQPSVAELPKIIFPPLPPKSAGETSTAVASGEQLSDDSKRILSKVPSKIDSKVKQKGEALSVSRITPELKSMATKTEPSETFESVGLKIKVQRPGLDTNYELNHAYNELTAGNTDKAIEIYKNILSAEPENEDALFGVASIYHRQAQLDKARPYYSKLLKVNPQHREGLNNFLALISDESPEEALAELERLEQRSPDFSPIPAQQALVLKKLGYLDQARDRMMHAIDLAPDNLTYKYNLAVILDQQGDVPNASALYRLLIDASLKGSKIPAPLETLQKRLNYITVNTSKPVQNTGTNG